VVVDRAQLTRHIRHALQDKSQITLAELCERQPLQQGLAELVAYLQLASDSFKSVVDEAVTDVIVWRVSSGQVSSGQCVTADGAEQVKQARLPRVIFVR